jgi:hypothetical protein
MSTRGHRRCEDRQERSPQSLLSIWEALSFVLIADCTVAYLLPQAQPLQLRTT